MPRFNEEKQEYQLSRLLHKEEEATVEMLAEKHHLPYANLATVPIDVDALGIVAENDARAGELAVIERAGKKLDVAVKNPDSQKTKEVLERLAKKNYTAALFLVSGSSLEKAWGFYQNVARRTKTVAGSVDISPQQFSQFRANVKHLSDIALLLNKVERQRVSDILEIILAGAFETDASDIHLEPTQDRVRLRFRLDGVLNDVAELPHAQYAFILSRIKLISEMKLNVSTRGQDGRFTIRVDEYEVEVRTSTLPGPYGENIVLRILNPKSIAVEFSQLGIHPTAADTLLKELEKPNGMILTTGPTGSGKTTTLYAFLRHIQKPGVKVITLEDPIEYHLSGIEQTQVESETGYDFISGLRSILRQDPDIIMVGEIRDKETAQTALHAALTGHLVFSTLHTNNAAGTIPRLLDLGVDPAIIAPALNVTMAQRLVRRLCMNCKEAYEPSAEEKAKLENLLKDFPKNVTRPPVGTLFRAKGCEPCSDTGYKGRIGVYEIILIDGTIEKLILAKPTEEDIKLVARKQNHLTMQEDAAVKVLQGTTDLKEVERVIGL